MPTKKLKEYLDKNHVKWEGVPHLETYTAQETAEVAHVPGREFAKTVMVNMDGNLAMAVVPAHMNVDFDLLKDLSSAESIKLASEDEFKGRFTDCQPGAMPPFGNLYGMQVFVDEMLSEHDFVAFDAGSHTELIKLKARDFQKLVKPKIAKITAKHKKFLRSA